MVLDYVPQSLQTSYISMHPERSLQMESGYYTVQKETALGNAEQWRWCPSPLELEATGPKMPEAR